MYEDMIAALLGDMQIDMPSGRASALRGQSFSQNPMVPPPQGMAPPPMLPQPMPPGPPPGPQMPPQATQPPPMPQSPPVGPSGPAPGPVLPQALAQQRPPPPPQAPDPYDASAALLQRQHDSAMTDLTQALQPPNTGPMQEAYRARAQQSPKYLLAAMAAQHAGMPEFAKHHMQQAASVDEPMKTATGTMTPQGFIEDPAYGQAMKVRSAEARVTAIERAQAQNISAAERRRLEKDKEEAKAELATQLAAYHRGTAVTVAGISASGKGEAAAGRQQQANWRTEDSLSKQFDGQVKDYVMEIDSTRKLGQLAPGARPNAIEQQSMIILLNRFLDPTSVVREGEFNRVAQAQGLVQRAQNFMDQILKGEPMSDELVRSVREMAKLYEQAASGKIQQVGDLYSEKATKRGLDPANVVVNPYYKHREPGEAAGGGTRPVKPPPPVGTKVNGFTFKGGDPANPASWSK